MCHPIDIFIARGDVEYAIELVVEKQTENLYGILGDHLMTNFECGVCHLRNFQGRYPIIHRLEDDRLSCAIMQASLDKLCSWRPGTVKFVNDVEKMDDVGDEVLELVRVKFSGRL